MQNKIYFAIHFLLKSFPADYVLILKGNDPPALKINRTLSIKIKFTAFVFLFNGWLESFLLFLLNKTHDNQRGKSVFNFFASFLSLACCAILSDTNNFFCNKKFSDQCPVLSSFLFLKKYGSMIPHADKPH